MLIYILIRQRFRTLNVTIVFISAPLLRKTIYYYGCLNSYDKNVIERVDAVTS